MSILITGAAGFIGFNMAKKLIENGKEIIGLDNFNSYYDPKLKEARYKELIKISQKKNIEISFYRDNLENKEKLENIFSKHNFSTVINLAAQAGVRYSIENPSAYIQSNIVGFSNILECCRQHQIKHLIYASSSSVYGSNKKIPFSEEDRTDSPNSLYAATKKSNEIMAHTYSHLYKINTFGLRFFTVYGPWGRPDMAPMLFTKNILEKKPISIFNGGNMYRDFTYIDDVINMMYKLINLISQGNNLDSHSSELADNQKRSHIFNVGNSNMVSLLEFIEKIENKLGIKSKKNFQEFQKGDVYKTMANSNKLRELIKYDSYTDLDIGLEYFIKWYLNFYKN